MTATTFFPIPYRLMVCIRETIVGTTTTTWILSWQFYIHHGPQIDRYKLVVAAKDKDYWFSVWIITTPFEFGFHPLLRLD
jgi:hypothetical protein